MRAVSACTTGTRERAALLRLDFGLELLVLDLLVALEGDAVDHRIFDDGDGQPSALDRRTNVLEQTGGIERLHAFVDLECVEAAARSRPEVGADGLGLDPLVALDDDGTDRRRLSIGDACRERHDTDALNKIPPRTRQATPSPRTSHLQSFIPHAPFVVPFGHPEIGYPRERSSLSPERPYRHAACTGFFLLCNQVLSPPCPFTPRKLQPPYDAVHWAARCRMSL